LVLVMSVSVCYASPWSAQDEEAQQVAQAVRSLLGGDHYDRLIMEEYGCKKVIWEGRGIPTGQAERITFLVSAEIKIPRKESLFMYFEIKLASVNVLPELARKYGLGV